MRASISTEVRTSELLFWVKGNSIQANIISGTCCKEKVGSGRVSHVHVMIVKCGLQLFSDRCSRDVGRGAVFCCI